MRVGRSGSCSLPHPSPGTRPTGDHLRSLCPEPTLVQLPLGSAGLDAYGHFIKAAEKLGVTEDARNDVLSMATNAERKGSPFASILIRRCSPGSQL
jgi:hypothetical protein